MDFLVLVPSNYVMNGLPLLVLLSLENLHISPVNLLNNCQLVMLYLGIPIVVPLWLPMKLYKTYTNNRINLIPLLMKNYNKTQAHPTLLNLYQRARISKKRHIIRKRRKHMPVQNVISTTLLIISQLQETSKSKAYRGRLCPHMVKNSSSITLNTFY